MKHKSWIVNYENNFEQLANEIGDLRYDTLSDFLNLLAEKIKADGEKDGVRGRSKLANSLQLAADSLADSAKHIARAWEICEPYLFPEDISQQIRNDFPDKAAQKKVFQLLNTLYIYNDHDSHFRLARCVLLETNGDFQKVLKNIQLASENPTLFMEAVESRKNG